MKIPLSIPEWIKFTNEFEMYGATVTFLTNALNGKYTGDLFIGKKTIRFKLIKNTKNIVLGFKRDDTDTQLCAKLFETIFEEKYILKYYANGNKFGINYEWYWGSTIEQVMEQIDKLLNDNKYFIIEKRNLTRVPEKEPFN